MDEKISKKDYLFIVILLLIFLIFSISSVVKKSITNDEIAHIAAGYSYLKTFDFRLNIEHPPLIKLLSGIFLLPLNPKIDLNDDSWVNIKEWEFGEKFFFKWNDNSDQLLFWARFPVILLGIVLGIYIFRWSFELFGKKAAYLSLSLYSFCPNILANSQLVTTDLGLAAFTFISSYYIWNLTKKMTKKNIAKAGISFGLALATKHTALFLIPIFIIYFLLIYKIKKMCKLRELFKKILHDKSIISLFFIFFVILIIGFFILTLSYFFAESEKYFSGLAFVTKHSTRGHLAYLNGEHSSSGWWYYFFEAFLLKTPIPVLILLLISIIYLFKRENLKNKFSGIHKDKLYEQSKKQENDLFLLIPIILFFVIFMFNKINIGLRYILPIYPFIFTFLGNTLNYSKNKIFRFFLILLLIWFFFSSILIYPHYLAYFNEIAGGPNNGYNYLIDSNIDWGQDLKGLAKYLKENNIEKINLGYFGKDSPKYRGIKFETIRCFKTEGIAAVSVNMLKGISVEQEKCLRWLDGYKPIAKIGYSIFIYNITEVDEEQEIFKFCRYNCNNFCINRGKNFKESSFENESCICICT